MQVVTSKEERKAAAAAGLKKSAGFVRHLLTERLDMKFSPQVEFFYDESFELDAKIKNIFENMPPSPGETEPSGGSSEG